MPQPFEIRAHLNFTGVPEGGLSSYGIMPGMLAHYLVDANKALEDWNAASPEARADLDPADYVLYDKIADAVQACIDAGAGVFVSDEEVTGGLLGQIVEEAAGGDNSRQGLADLLLDAAELTYQEFQAALPDVRMGHYDIVHVGNRLWWENPSGYESQMAVLLAHWDRIHQRWNGSSLEAHPRHMCDIIALNVGRSGTLSEWIGFIRSVLAEARTRLALDGQPVWWWGVYCSYEIEDRGMPVDGTELRDLLVSIGALRDLGDPSLGRWADGAFLWYESMASQAWPYFRVTVLTSTPATWAAVSDAKIRVFLAHSLEVQATVDFTGVSTMDQVASALETAINSARSGDGYGTLTVTWEADPGELRFALSHEGGTYASPPGIRGVMTNLRFGFNSDGEKSIGADGYGLIDAVLDPPTPVPHPPPEDEFDDWVRDGSGNLRETWAGIAEAGEILSMSTTSPANHASYSDTGSGGDFAVTSALLAATDNGQNATTSLFPAESTHWARGTNDLDVSGLASGNPVSIINLRVEAAKSDPEEDDGTLHVRLVSSTGDVLSDTKTFTIDQTTLTATTLGGDDWGGVTADDLIAGVRIEWRVTTGEVNGGNYGIDHVGAFQVTFDASPVVSITSPADGATLATGGPVTLTATATDPEDGDLADEIQWESDIDGPLGTGASINVELSLGTHTITATVEDSGGNVDTDEIGITVAESGGVRGKVGAQHLAILALDGMGLLD